MSSTDQLREFNVHSSTRFFTIQSIQYQQYWARSSIRCLYRRMVTEHILFGLFLGVWFVNVHLFGSPTKRYSSSDHYTVGFVRRIDLDPSRRCSLADGCLSTNSTVMVATRQCCGSSLCLNSKWISTMMIITAYFSPLIVESKRLAHLFLHT